MGHIGSLSTADVMNTNVVATAIDAPPSVELPTNDGLPSDGQCPPLDINPTVKEHESGCAIRKQSAFIRDEHQSCGSAHEHILLWR